MASMRLNIWLKILASVVSILLFSLIQAAYAEAQTAASIGVATDLSGPAREIGSAFKNGIELARGQSPELFVRLHVIYEDHRYDPKTAIAVYQKLRTRDKIDLLLCWGEPIAAALAPLAERDALPLFASSIDPNPAIGRSFTIRMPNYSEQYSSTALSYLRDNHFKHIALVKAEDPFFEQLVQGLRKNLQDGESLDDVCPVQPDEYDFKTCIMKIKAGKHDIIGNYLMPDQVSIFLRQAHDLGLRLPSFGTDSFESESVIREAKGTANGVVYPNIKIPEDFRDSYVHYIGNDTQITYAYIAYHAAILIARSLGTSSGHSSGGETITKIIDAARKTSGPYTFVDDSKGGKYIEFPLEMKRIVDNRIMPIHGGTS